MTTPQDLANRLEKAIEALIAASLQILHHDGRDGDDVDVYERAQLRKAFTPILASLRRSAPASGEMGEAIDMNAEANAFAMELLMPTKFLLKAIRDIGGVSIEDDEKMDGLARKFKVQRQILAVRLLKLDDELRSGETGEEAGS